MEQDNTPLFKSAHTAITFALNYGITDHVERSPASKMADDRKGSGGHGLIGMDGAAQAGIILAELKRTGAFHEACVIARVAKRKILCNCGAECCCKHRPNWQWRDAINSIAMLVKDQMEEERKEGTRGMKDSPVMRQAIIAKFFGERIRVKELAHACDVTEGTVSNHTGKINKILKHTENEAWNLLEEALRSSGIVGDI
jgi:hypothetical protein